MLDVFYEKYWRMETLPWIFLPSFTCNNKRISLQLHCFVLVFSIGFKGFRTKISPFIKRVKPKLFDATSVIREHFSNWLELNAQRNTIAPLGKKYSSLTNFAMTHLNRGEVVMQFLEFSLLLPFVIFFRLRYVTISLHSTSLLCDKNLIKCTLHE